MSDVHVCPWWAGYLLANPLRKIFQNPDKMLKQYIRPGDCVLEIGPGMGFFTLPAAKIAGESGKIITVDIQEKMLENLMNRAQRKKLDGRIVARLCNNDSFCIDDLTSSIDFCMLLYVVHEIPDKQRLFRDASNAMKPGAKVLFSEPPGHVTKSEFEQSVSMMRDSGFKITGRPQIWRLQSAIAEKI